MSLGFKKSLFGFNCDQVVKYITDSDKKYSEKELVLNETIQSLSEDNVKLTNENEVMKKQLEEFNKKCNEINRISEKIGKMYLIANVNAKAIMQNAIEDAQLTENETAKDIALLDELNNKLAELKTTLVGSSKQFENTIDSIDTSLQDAKSTIAKNQMNSSESINDFNKEINP